MVWYQHMTPVLLLKYVRNSGIQGGRSTLGVGGEWVGGTEKREEGGINDGGTVAEIDWFVRKDYFYS